MIESFDRALAFLCLISLTVSCIVTMRYYQLMRLIRWVPPPDDGRERRSRITVIVPARNEELDLEQCLSSILAQRGVDLHVIIVNDHSSDRTGEIANAIAARDSRVRVLHNPPLKPGWLGKVNAMQHAFEHAQDELIMFADADVIHLPDCFASLVAVMESQQLDFVSLMPRIQCVSLFENVNVPAYLGGFCQIVGDGLRKGSDRAFGAGAGMLVRRQALIAAGGLEAIKAEMLDDVELATLIRRAGFQVGFWASSQLFTVRLFKGNRSAFWGPTKNVLAEFKPRMWVAPLAMFMPLIIFGMPIFTVGWGAALGNWPLAALGVGAYLGQYLLLYFPSREMFEFHAGKLLFFPLVSLVLICCFLRAFYHYYVRGAVLWRGRSIQVQLKS